MAACRPPIPPLGCVVSFFLLAHKTYLGAARLLRISRGGKTTEQCVDSPNERLYLPWCLEHLCGQHVVQSLAARPGPPGTLFLRCNHSPSCVERERERDFRKPTRNHLISPFFYPHDSERECDRTIGSFSHQSEITREQLSLPLASPPSPSGIRGILHP